MGNKTSGLIRRFAGISFSAKKGERVPMGYRGEAMTTAILVAYATKHGSTEEVAGEIARVITGSGRQVRLLRAADVRDLAPFGLVVLGAPLYTGKWHKDAIRFLKRLQPKLEQRPVAVFALGPRSPREEGNWPRCRGQLERALAKLPWLKPVAVELFGGVDPPKKGERRDQRDWGTIRAWAAEIAAKADVEPGPTDDGRGARWTTSR
jgi:menaquinone-dependent protoporphyrinogen oxidase